MQTDNTANANTEATFELPGNSTALVDIVNQLPSTPYTESELIQHTGNNFGLTLQDSPANIRKRIRDLTGKDTIGIYDLCPCGSLKKYKFCCVNK